jgi:hypothetical protein
MVAAAEAGAEALRPLIVLTENVFIVARARGPREGCGAIGVDTGGLGGTISNFILELKWV